jgi:hypothetical protein
MTYPQPEDWPTDERMNNIGPNGNDGDHYELTNYLSKEDIINALKKENELLKKRVESEIKSKSKWKCKFEKVRPERKSIRTVKNQTAINMICAREKGDKTHSLADIGRLLNIRYGTLKNMAYMYRQSVITKKGSQCKL